MKLVNWLAG